MKRTISRIAFVFSALTAAEPAAPVMFADGVMVAASGMTLYAVDRDAAGSGRSVCNGGCAAAWTPLAAGPNDKGGDYTVVTRDDGATQRAWKGKPLYFRVKDAKPGDRTGDGFNGVWRVVKQ